MKIPSHVRLILVLGIVVLMSLLVVPYEAQTSTTITFVSGNGPIGTLDPINYFTLDGGVTFQQAFIVSPETNYHIIPGTKYINRNSTTSGPTNATTRYRTTFTLPSGFSSPFLTVEIHADNVATLFLNGFKFGEQPIGELGTNFQNPAEVFTISDATKFNAGQNFLQFDIFNFGGPTAFDYKATLSFATKPTANAGPDQSVPEDTLLVTLDGTGSTGASLTYTWTQVAGPPVALSGGTTAHPTFSAPPVPAAGSTVTFELVVCEGTSSNCSDPDSVNVHITYVNQPPVADAGPDQTVQEGSPVMLDGTGSYDPDVEVLTYQWTHILGPAPVSLTGANSASPTFTAPTVGPAGDTIVFDLTVTDPHNLTGSDSVSIHVSNVNQIPVANAGPDQTVDEITLVTLNGTGSFDPDLDTLLFTWTQTVGPLVSLTGANTASPTFTAPSVGVGGTTLTFKLVVSDGQANSVDEGTVNIVNIHVLDTNDPPVCTLAQPSVASLWPPNHTMVPVTIMGVTDPNNQTVTFTFPAVTQDEPVNGLGDGDTSPDAAVSGNQILLRAERAGTGNGRVYVVQFTASDGQGGSCTGTVTVSVPHSKKVTAIDSGQNFNSFGP